MLKFMSFWTDPILPGGYSFSAIFEYWFIGLIIIILAVVAVVAVYFLLSWLFGRMKFGEGDKQTLDSYRNANKADKKDIAKDANRPVKNVILWKKMRFWFVPVVLVSALLVGAVSSFVPSAAFKNMIVALTGPKEDTYDSEAARQAAAEAEVNVAVIEEEGLVLLKNTNDSLPLKAKEGEEKIKVNIFGSCAYGLFYGNGGSGSFQTDGRVSSFPRVALKLVLLTELTFIKLYP